jgi:hypothetical protein
MADLNEIYLLRRYVEQFNKELTADLVAQVNRNRWIKSGRLLDSINDTTITDFNNRIILTLNLVDYYVFFDGKKRKTSTVKAKTKGVDAKTKRVSVRAFKGGTNIASSTNKNNFVDKTINRLLPITEKSINNTLSNDIAKAIEASIGNQTINVNL